MQSNNNFRFNGLQPLGAFLPNLERIKKMEQEKKPSYVPQELKGRITHNKYKKKDTEPDMKGSLCVEGKIVNFGVWRNEGQYGEYFSIKVSDPNWNKQQYPKDVTPSGYPKDSDVPF